ncbi:PLP-dependent transferase [Enterococcus sp. 669A]|uniref:PLP-dependent transferase n=1 Tax=Candidatus Enterococcus moelleringii TaxID=2815325 RepID=A0ABS3LHW6_9ENTE|nr:PLP-dependent aspartate aminotransferase family protein [Enterococcus sp. 669A]MBO1307969.1 PLP-dependent transferase [Enterococcus sp. 669A]
MKIESLLVQGISAHNNPYGAIVPPIFLASTYIQPAIGEEQDFAYSRGGNPTRNQVEDLLGQLEEAQYSYAFASGMAATSSVFQLLKHGDKVLLNNNIYGGTFRYLDQLFESRGLEYQLVEDFNHLSEEHFDLTVKMIFIETPSNPLLEVTDIKRISELAHQHGAVVAVDNTFMTAYLQKPLALGADIVTYSATKYLSGHADLIAGAVLTNDQAIGERLKVIQNTLGNILSPFDSYSLIRGIKTLAVRMDRQIENTHKLIVFLQSQAISVNFAGAHSKEEAAIQSSQATGIGAVISFELPEEYDLSVFVQQLKMFPLAVSLGGVESLICHPASMTHESYSQDLREKIGISDRLLRVAVGIENSEDLVADVAQALKQAKGEI